MQRLLNLLGTSVLVTSSATVAVSTISFNNQNITNSIQNNQYEKGFNNKTHDKIRINENRQFDHSEFKPTGYFLKAGFSYLIHLNNSENTTDLVIGQWGNYQNLNQYDDTFDTYKTTGQTTWITPQNSGMLYIADDNQSNLEIITITSNTPNAIIKVPTFIVNQTNQVDFINEILRTNSPFVEFKSKHYFATMQTKMILNEVLPSLQRSFNETLLHWDNVWKWTNEIYGLNDSGINKKTTQYIHIANADSSIGLANTTHGRLMFHNSYGAGKNLFIQPLSEQWALWHETGHSYQTPQYLWNGLVEVTVNISSLYIQEKMNLPLRIFEMERINWLNDYFSQPNRDFNSLTGDKALWIKLAMFWQLHMGFGNNFYPLLNQKYREINQELNSLLDFIETKKQIQEFIKITSEITGYNLSSFFKYWGLNPTWETDQEISKYKILTAPIWDNIVDWNTKNYPIIQKKLAYTKLSDFSNITSNGNVINFGEKINNIQKYLNIPSSINPNDLKISTKFEPFKYQGQYYISLKIKLSEPNKRPNIKIFLIRANLNNTIMFQREFGGEYLGMFGLDTQNNQIKFYGTSTELDNSPPSKILYNLQIKTDYGGLIKDIYMDRLESFNDIMKKYYLEAGIPYFNNYQITITNYVFNEVKYTCPYIFNQNDYQKINSSTATYIIQNNSLIRIY